MQWFLQISNYISPSIAVICAFSKATSSALQGSHCFDSVNCPSHQWPPRHQVGCSYKEGIASKSFHTFQETWTQICSDLTLKWTRSWHLGRPRLQIPQLTSAWNRGFSLAQQAHIYHPDPELNLGSSLLSVLVFLCLGQWEKSFYLGAMYIKRLFGCLSPLSFAGVKMQSNSLQPYPCTCPSLHCASVLISSSWQRCLTLLHQTPSRDVQGCKALHNSAVLVSSPDSASTHGHLPTWWVFESELPPPVSNGSGNWNPPLADQVFESC